MPRKSETSGDSKPRVYADILAHIRKHDPELYEIVNELGAQRSLSLPHRTFLWPKSPGKTREVLLSWADSDEHAEAAEKMLRSLILYNAFKTPADMAAQADDLANENRQRLHVVAQDSSGLTLAPDAKIIPDPDMLRNALKDRDIAVWQLSGHLGVTEDMPSAGKYKTRRAADRKRAARGAAGIEGGYEFTPEEESNIRNCFAAAVTLLYTREMRAGRRGNPFITYAYAVADWVMREHPDEFLDRVYPLMAGDESDFFLLIEPYRKDPPQYLIPTEWITQWRDGYSFGATDLETIRQNIAKFIDEKAPGRPELVLSSPVQILRAADKLRKGITDEKKVPAAVVAVYAELAKENKIGDVGPVYSESLHDYYKAQPEWLLVSAELRAVVAERYEAHRRASYDAAEGVELEATADIAKDYMTGAQKSMMFTFTDHGTLFLNPGLASAARKFAHSTNFLFVPHDAKCEEWMNELAYKRDKRGEEPILNVVERNKTVKKQVSEENTKRLHSMIKAFASSMKRPDPDIAKMLEAQ